MEAGLPLLVPFQVPHPKIPFVMMQGEAGGAPVRVLLDTGDATPHAVLIGPQSKASAGAKPTGEKDYVTHAVAGGREARITPARLAEFHLGPIQLSNVDAGLSASVDVVASRLPGGVDAIVGYQFIATRVVAIDYGAHVVDFAAQPGAADQALPMIVTPKHPLTVVEATINGRGPFQLVLDTGAGGTILSPEAARRAGIGTNGVELQIGGAGGFGSTGRLERADLVVGAHHWEKSPLIVADMLGPVSEEAGMAIDGILGAPELAKGTLILDYPGRRVWIDGQAEAAK
jgi:predicted aspartyl protease